MNCDPIFVYMHESNTVGTMNNRAFYYP